MTRFLQLHVLTPYPPSSPNRDDLGRPKTALLGGVPRMRISSQAIKRAIRTSDVFAETLGEYLGQRTRRIGEVVLTHLLDQGRSFEQSAKISRTVASAFGKMGSASLQTEQMVFISPDELCAALSLADRVAAGQAIPKDREFIKSILRTHDSAVDIAMFGRMLADNPTYNRDAAVQVSHALTTNEAVIEDDFYTAVDDVTVGEREPGAGFLGETAFGAGVYYLYVCVDLMLLRKNLENDHVLAAKSLDALVRAVAMASPSGKRKSFANHVRAEFLLGEIGDDQPRTLASAFLQPVGKGNQLELSVERLIQKRSSFAATYGKDWTEDICLHVGNNDSATLGDVAALAGRSVA